MKQSRNDIGVPLLKKLFEGGKSSVQIAINEGDSEISFATNRFTPYSIIDLDFEPKEFPVVYSKKLKTIIDKFKPA